MSAVREFRPEVKAELEALCARYPKRDAALLPALRLLEREFGCVDNAGMRHVAELVGVSPAKVFGVFTFYTHYRRESDGRYSLQVCSTLPCALKGSEKLFDHLSKKLGCRNGETTKDGLFTLKKVECLGNCDKAPTLQVNEDFMDLVTEEAADAMIEAARAMGTEGAVPGFGPYHPAPQQYVLPPSPYKPVLLAHVTEDGSHTIGHYMARGGYDTARAVLNGSKTPEEVTQIVLDSNLRGRGGAGFPTGRKWTFLPKNDKPRYLVINADESEPGTFKDKMIMDRDPHVLIEGIILASYAIKAKAAYIYIRGEFPEGAKILNKAIAEAYEKGFLGADVFGTGHSVDITVHRGAGAYICGEETGLLSSLEGGRGHPKIKPPFPAVEGAWRSPTIVNNVETIAQVALIVKNGAQWFKDFGTEDSAGTKVFCVSGNVVRPGVYELPMGKVSLKELIFDICGGIPNGRKLKAVIPGGSSAPVLTADEVLNDQKPVMLEYKSIADAGSMLGSGGVIVIDDSNCMVEGLWNLLRFYHHESCGQCTPCRDGTGWIEKMAGRFERGGGKMEQIDMLDELAWGMVGRTICVLADAAAFPTRSFVKKFRKDFEDHVTHQGCPYKAGQPKKPLHGGGHHHA